MPTERDPLVEHFTEIDAVIREAIALVALLRRPLFDQEFTQRFSNTLAAHGLEATRRNLHRSAVMLVGRLWDKRHDARSIPNLWNIASSTAGKARFLGRRRASAMNVTRSTAAHSISTLDQRHVDETERGAHAELGELTRLVEDETASRLRDSILVLRHRIAHAVTMTDREKRAAAEGLTIERAKWGDVEQVVRHSADVATGLALITQDLPASYEDSWETWATYADHYWNSFTHPT